MKKLLLLSVFLISTFSIFADQVTTSVTANSQTWTFTYNQPINPSADTLIEFDGSGSNFANWTPSTYVHIWLIVKDGMTFSQNYSTVWKACDGDTDYATIDTNRKMTHDGVANSGKYSISVNLESLLNIASADLTKIDSLGIIVLTQYSKYDTNNNNSSANAYLDVEANAPVVSTVQGNFTPTAYKDEAMTFAPTSTNITTPVYTFEVKTPSTSSYSTITSPYTPTEIGNYSFVAHVAEQANSATILASDTVSVTVSERIQPKDIAIKVLTKPSTWTESTLSVYYWNDTQAGQTAAMTFSNNEYSFTVNQVTDINVIFINGTTWNGNANQTANITSITDNTCYNIKEEIDSDNKHTTEIVDCNQDPTNNSTINSDEILIEATNNMLSISNSGVNIMDIYSISGQRVHSSKFTNHTEITLNKGSYILVINNKAHKVLIP